jgi:predicted AAA+ superfamily ATPase
LRLCLADRARGLKRGEIVEGSELFGTALEHLVFLELRAYLDYRRSDLQLSFWRTHSGFEVDFVVGDALGIEVKATRHVTPRDLRGLRALSEDLGLKSRVVVSMEARERVTDDGITVLPVAGFLRRLWGDEMIGA